MFSAPWFQPLKDLKFSPPCIVCHILEYEPQDVLYLPDLFGVDCIMMFETGAVLVTLRQQSKVLRHVQLRHERIPVPYQRFHHFHVDLVGPLPSTIYMHRQINQMA